MNHIETYHQYRPRHGEPISYGGRVMGHAIRTEGGLCWVEYLEPDKDPLPFIWCFRDGLNALHDWPSKAGGKVAFCPRVS